MSVDDVKLLAPMVGIFPKNETVFKLVQALKALAPMEVTEAGIIILVKPEHPLNAEVPIPVIELLIIRLVIPVLLVQAEAGMEPA